jgi:tellurite resistance protein TehA-like permease
MMTRQDHSLEKMAAVWLLPLVSLVVASSSGGLLVKALREPSLDYALLTSAVSFAIVLMGLAFAFMVMTIYFLRLILFGPPEAGLILSAFVVVGPLGQGGYSLLINGEQLALILPVQLGESTPYMELAGKVAYGFCFCGAYVLW